MKKTFDIISSTTLVKNDKITVVEVIIRHRASGGLYSGIGRAKLHSGDEELGTSGDIDVARFGEKLARSRAIEKAIKKVAKDAKLLKETDELYAKRSAEIYANILKDYAEAEERINQLLLLDKADRVTEIFGERKEN